MVLKLYGHDVFAKSDQHVFDIVHGLSNYSLNINIDKKTFTQQAPSIDANSPNREKTKSLFVMYFLN